LHSSSSLLHLHTYNDGGVALRDLDSGVFDLDFCLRLLGDGDLLDLLYGNGDLESAGDLEKTKHQIKIAKSILLLLHNVLSKEELKSL